MHLHCRVLTSTVTARAGRREGRQVCWAVSCGCKVPVYVLYCLRGASVVTTLSIPLCSKLLLLFRNEALPSLTQVKREDIYVLPPLQEEEKHR